MTVDTLSVLSSTGFVDWQFNNGGSSSQAATATISAFTILGGGTLQGLPDVAGTVSGTLPSTVAIDNSDGFNDYFQGIAFGTSFQFVLTLDGPAITAPNGSLTGSSFGLSLYEADGTTPRLTVDPYGYIGVIDISGDGSITPNTFPPSFESVAPVLTIGPVPEPATLGCTGLLLAALYSLQRLRRPAR